MGLTITITNVSSVEWQRSHWKAAAGQDETVGTMDSIVKTPSKTLRKMSGRTDAQVETYALEWLAHDKLYVIVGYSYGDRDWAVRLQQNFQFASMGKGTTWSYLQAGRWHEAGEHSEPVTWHFEGCAVLATPTLRHQEGSIDVLIKDA